MVSVCSFGASHAVSKRALFPSIKQLHRLVTNLDHNNRIRQILACWSSWTTQY